VLGFGLLSDEQVNWHGSDYTGPEDVGPNTRTALQDRKERLGLEVIPTSISFKNKLRRGDVDTAYGTGLGLRT